MTQGIEQLRRNLASWLLLPGAWISPRHMRFWVIVIIVSYSLSGFFLLPWIGKAQIISRVGELLQRPVQLDELRINPYLLSVEARGFSISEVDGSHLAGFDRLLVNFQLSSIFNWAWTFREIRIEGPSIEFVRLSPDDTNLSRLPFANTDQQSDPGDSAMPRLLIEEMAISDGIVGFTDHVPETQFDTVLGPINVVVRNLSTLPNDSGRQEVVIQTEQGGQLAWSGSLQIDPLRSTGRVEGGGRYVPFLYRYYQDILTIEEPVGRAELGFDYEIGNDKNGNFTARVNNLDFTLRDLVVKSKDNGAEIFNFPETRISGGWLRWPEHSVGAKQFVLSNPEIRLWRERDGMLNLQNLVTVQNASESTANSVQDNGGNSNDNGWTIELDEFELKNLQAELNDKSLNQPGIIQITRLDFSMADLSNQPGASFPLSLDAEWAPGGRTQLTGNLTALPVAGIEGELTVSDLQIVAIQPYLSDAARVLIEQGKLNINANFSVSEQESLVTSGSIAIQNLNLMNAENGKRLLGWNELTIDRYEFAAEQLALEISEIVATAPYVRFRINEDNSTNFQQLLIERNDGQQIETDAAAGTAPGQAKQKIIIGRIGVDGGSADFTDLTLPIPFSSKIQDLNGEITTLATNSEEPARVDLEGRVDEYGLARIRGSVTPFDPTQKTDMQLLFRNVGLPDLSPYTVKFAGREIADGRLELDLRYQITAGQMEGANKIILSDLELGREVDQPDAMNLPLGLAVALLTGPDGKIDIDLPVSGDINDPEFKIGGVVVKALFNLLTNIITSPFRLLASLVGIDSEDFDIIEFEPGQASLTPPELEKLDKLNQALIQRPTLRLLVPGIVDEKADSAVLRESRTDASIDEKLKSMASEEDGQDDSEMLTLRLQRVHEALFQVKFPDLPLETVRAEFLHPQDPDDAESELLLDEAAYTAELRNQLVAAVKISQKDLEMLARTRAEAVASVLIASGKVDAKRIELQPRIEVSVNNSGWIPMQLTVDSGIGD